MREHPILGAWTLLEWVIEYPDGRRRHPYGEDAQGRLLYTPDGQMLAAVSRAAAAPLQARVPREATVEEKAAAFDAYFSYGGRFELDGDEVLHHVEIALNPAMIGTTQRRRLHLHGQDLTLSAAEPHAAGQRQHILRWTRSAPA
jgi:hypothetical protein